jgi:two-component system, cell cycle response regulator DivK
MGIEAGILILVAGETILVVEDAAVSLRLAAALLRNEGYKVHIASNAEQALSTLKTLRPHLMLVDIHLPGMSGLELARQAKLAEDLHQVIVVAMTASTDRGDEQRARDAGCDGFFTKSADTAALTMRVREYLEHRPATEAPAASRASEPQTVSLTLPESQMEDLRRSFLEDAVVQSRRLLAGPDSQFDATAASRMVHAWAGTAELLGLPGVAASSREAEAILGECAAGDSRIRAAMIGLARAFASPDAGPPDSALPEFIVEELKGKRVALIGLGEAEADRMCHALERAGAKPRLFEENDPPDSPPIRECNALVVHVRPETSHSPWLDPESLVPPLIPLLFLGRRERLLSLDIKVYGRAREFLIDGWQPEEALMRLSAALSRPVAHVPGVTAAATEPAATQPGSPAVPAVAEILVADDDVTVRTLVRAALENDGMHCRVATNGAEALQVIRDHRPHAAVLDVNMPGMDGFEVLAAIRAEALPVRVVLLTSRQHQNDVVRGFSLGADDYIIKPFRPTELVARVKRLLA